MLEKDNPSLGTVVNEQIRDIFSEKSDAFALASFIETLNKNQTGRPIAVALVKNEQKSKEQISGIIFPVTSDELQHAVLLNNNIALIVGPAKKDPASVDKYKKALAPELAPITFSAEYADLKRIAELFYEGRYRFGSTVLMRNTGPQSTLQIKKLLNQGLALSEERKKKQEKPPERKEVLSGSITIFDRTIDFGFRFKFGRKNK